MSGMQFLLGIKTKDFVMLCADQSDFLMGAIVLKEDGTKTYRLGEKTLMMCYGEGGDPEQFSEYIEKNLKLYQMRNGYELGPKAVGHYVRRTVAQSLRSQDSYLVFLLLGGYDERNGGGYLTSMDYLGNQFESNYLAQGLGGRFTTSILDSIYKPDWSEAEALEGLKSCVKDVRKRCAIALPQFEVFVVDKEGTRQLDSIRP